jgi:hypothetical protein
VARFDIDGVLFELVPAEEKDKLSGKGNARLCLETGDIDQTVAELRSNSVSVEDPRNIENRRISSFWDLDGNEICIWEYKNHA